MTVQLSPAPYLQFLDNNGNALSFGTVQTFAAGTITPIATWVDATQTTTNTNPVVLDLAGRANIWLDTSLSYKFAVADQFGNPIRTTDNIISAPIPPSLKPITGSFILTGVGFSGSPPTGTANYLYIPGFFAMMSMGLFGTSNSTSFSMTGLPAFLQPASLNQVVPALIENNGAEVPNGAMGVNAGSGTLVMFLGGSTTGWTASGGKGTDGLVFWLLQ